MKDDWEFDDSEVGILEEKDTMDSNKGNTEESANANEKASDMDDDKNTNRNTGGTEEKMVKKSRLHAVLLFICVTCSDLFMLFSDFSFFESSTLSSNPSILFRTLDYTPTLGGTVLSSILVAFSSPVLK